MGLGAPSLICGGAAEGNEGELTACLGLEVADKLQEETAGVWGLSCLRSLSLLSILVAKEISMSRDSASSLVTNSSLTASLNPR